MLTRANGLCARLDAVLLQLSRTGSDTVAPEDLAALRQRVMALAGRLVA